MRRYNWITCACMLVGGIIAGCTSSSENQTPFASTQSSAEERYKILVADLQMYRRADKIRKDEYVEYIARHAASFGVKRIRAMKQSEKPNSLTGGATGCGRAIEKTGEIIIDVDRDWCFRLPGLFHEMAHISMFRQNCRGHGDRFYRENYRLALQFQQTFPETYEIDDIPKGVLKRAQEYRTGEKLCPGKVDIQSG